MTFLIIAAGILATALLAYAIVNYIPRKLHWIISIILIALAAFLVYKINFEIQKPINFNKEKKVKYAKVIKNMRIIRDAEVAKIPFMVIVGEKEEETGTVSVRKHGEGDLGTFTIEEFIAFIKKEEEKTLKSF